MRVLNLFVTSLVVVLAPAGCAPTSPPNEVHSAVPIPVGHYSAISLGTNSGILILRGECLLFRDVRSGVHYLPVWPRGSRSDGRFVVLAVPNRAERPLRVGSRVTIDGSVQDWGNVRDPTVTGYRARCGASPMFVSDAKYRL